MYLPYGVKMYFISMKYMYIGISLFSYYKFVGICVNNISNCVIGNVGKKGFFATKWRNNKFNCLKEEKCQKVDIKLLALFCIKISLRGEQKGSRKKGNNTNTVGVRKGQ